MRNNNNILLTLSVIVLIASLVWLATGGAIPYQIIRSSIYTTSAFLYVLAISIIASYWLDISDYKIKEDRNPRELRLRFSVALLLVTMSNVLLGIWNIQEERELSEAKSAYSSGDYVLSKELLIQQRQRFWSTDSVYEEITKAIAAAEAGSKYEDLRVKRAAYTIDSEKHKQFSVLINQYRASQIKNYPWSE